MPDGADETGNVEHHHFGAKRNYPFQPKQHFELGEELAADGFRDRREALRRALCRAEKRARADGARARAVHVDVHTTEHGYTEIDPPLLVRDEAMFGTAQLPKFEDDQFSATSALTVDDAGDKHGDEA